MSTKSVALAVDLGASSGRVVAGVFDGELLVLEEVRRFPTRHVQLGDSCHWDILFIYSEILQGLAAAVGRYGSQIKSIGVDTWGVDYGLLDQDGKLLGNPFQYRDSRTDGMRELAASLVCEDALYEETGVQPMFFNTLYQLLSEVKGKKAQLEVASKLLFLPDLLNYWLSGISVNERTIASTSQMLNPRTGKWSEEMLQRMGIPTKILGEIVEPGTVLGPLLASVGKRIGAPADNGISLVAVGSHDTTSAVAGRPAKKGQRAFLSSGTWSLLGMVADEPVLSREAKEQGFSNEMGIEGKVRFLTNICGLWLLQKCRDQWIAEGEEISFAEMAELAEAAEPFFAVIDPDHSSFSKAGGMTDKICKYCADTGQAVPQSKGQVLRVVTESLAAKYRIVWDRLQAFAPEPLDSLNVVGGGCQNALLNQCTANALGVTLTAGPVEATAMGNVTTQFVALGLLPSQEAARDLVRRSAETINFEPTESSLWAEYVDRFRRIVESETSHKLIEK